MRIGDLGPLVVEHDDRRAPVVGTKGAAMLAMLLIHANHHVSSDALTEAAWGEHVTAGAPSTLLSHVWRLRQLLEPDRVSGQAPEVLLNDAGGYRLIGSAATVDSLFVVATAARLRDLVNAGRLEDALSQAGAALGRWRGRPYSPVTDADWAAPAVARLDEVQAQLQSRRVEALVGLGAYDAALSDLGPLIAEQPFHEPLRALQMEALHRSGRTEEALDAFQRTRSVLVDEVGIEPGRDLQTLHRRILDDDLPAAPSPAPITSATREEAASATPATPAAGAGEPTGAGGEAPSRPPATSDQRVSGTPTDTAAGASPEDERTPPRQEVHLPAVFTDLIGRAEETDRLSQLVHDNRLVTLTGPAGCGKTRTAVEIARSSADTFADGVWFIDLAPVDSPDLVVDVIVSAIGFKTTGMLTATQNLAGYLNGRAILLLLDNCEHVLDAATPLVEQLLSHAGADSASRILTTSREPLGVAGEVTWTLEPLGVPSDPTAENLRSYAAVELFLQRVAESNPAMTIDTDAERQAARICISLDGLPLPIELAAARATAFALSDIARHVAADPTRLRQLGSRREDHRSTLQSTIDWSYRLLTDDEQRGHRLLSVLPGPFTAAAAVHVLTEAGAPTGADRTATFAPGPSVTSLVDDDQLDEAEDLLLELVHRSMLTSAGSRRRGRPTRFRQLVTVRGHARRELSKQSPTAYATALSSRDDYVAHLVSQRPALGTVEEAHWYERLDDDYALIRATLTRALIEQPTLHGARMAPRLSYYWYYREKIVEGTRWLQLSHDLLRDEDPHDLTITRLALGNLLILQGRAAEASRYIDECLAFTADPDDPRAAVIVEQLCGLVSCAWITDAHALAIASNTHLRRLVEEITSPHLHLLADAVDVNALAVLGQPEAALAKATDVQTRAAAMGVPMASWLVSGVPMRFALDTAQPEAGIPWVEQCMAAHFPYGTGIGATFIETRANYAAQQNDWSTAAHLYAASQAISRRLGLPWPWREISARLLETTRVSFPEDEMKVAWAAGRQLTPLGVLDFLRSRRT